MSKFVLGKTSRARLADVEDVTYALVEAALALTPYDFGIAQDGGFRSATRQNELFMDGASLLDGYNKKSYHQTGLAVDYFGYVKGKLTYDHTVMATIAAAFLQVGPRILAEFGYEGYVVEWGGFWKNPVDMPHIQIVKRF